MNTCDAWIKKADADMAAAAVLMNAHDDALFDIVCFHCQQAAEKVLKGVMDSEGRAVPKIHSLPQLTLELATVLPALIEYKEDIAWLSTFAVDVRYPQSPTLAVTRDHARKAIAIAEQIKTICEDHLGLE